MTSPYTIDDNFSKLICKKTISYSADSFVRSMKISPDGNYILSSNENNLIEVHKIPLSEFTKNSLKYYQKSNEKDDFAETNRVMDSKENIVEYSDTDISSNSESNITKDNNRLDPMQSINIGESVYDIAWYPHMYSQLCDNDDNDESNFPKSLSNPTTCYITTSKDHPIHLYDCFSNELRCSYTGINHLDELDPAVCVKFNLGGDKIYAGTNRMIRSFDVANPGRQVGEQATTKSRRDPMGQKGLISCIDFNPDRSGAYAAGSFQHSVGIYVENQKYCALQLNGLGFGVTSVKWSVCGNNLWVGGRKNKSVVCWDIRYTRTEIGRVERECNSNQKIGFDLDPWGETIATGSSNGKMLIYNTKTFELIQEVHPELDACTEKCVPSPLPMAVNNVQYHPFYSLILSSSGDRKVLPVAEEEDDEEAQGFTNSHVPCVTQSFSNIHLHSLKFNPMSLDSYCDYGATTE